MKNLCIELYIDSSIQDWLPTLPAYREIMGLRFRVSWMTLPDVPVIRLFSEKGISDQEFNYFCVGVRYEWPQSLRSKLRQTTMMRRFVISTCSDRPHPTLDELRIVFGHCACGTPDCNFLHLPALVDYA